jgi:hypothetical protein
MSIIKSSFIIGLDKNDNLIKESQNIDIDSYIKNLNQNMILHSMIKIHDNIIDNDFIFIIRNGEIINKEEIESANTYIKNSNRSYHFEGLKKYNKSNLFYINWGS